MCSERIVREEYVPGNYWRSGYVGNGLIGLTFHAMNAVITHKHNNAQINFH